MNNFGMPSFIKNLDMFGKPIPGFNLRGKTSIKTSVGAICSILILMVMFAFGLLKLQKLVGRKNPLLVFNKDKLDAEEFHSTGSDSFMMAFSQE